LYEYNFGRLAEYAASSAQRLAWAEERLRRDLALGRHWREMLAAARDGEETFELVDGDFRAQMGLARRREELQMRPDEMFRQIRSPALALAGANDMNVPPEHAARAAAIMRKAGNAHATSVLVHDADHSFQETAADADLRLRERYTFDSFRRPYQPRAYREILAWLHEHVPTSADVDGSGVDAVVDTPAVRAESETEIDDKTETTPRRVQLAPGVEIVEDITDAEETAAVETLEGRIGPLLLAEECQAHFIDMPGGMYVEEHPHRTESIIYTVRGRWVLCSRGRRHLMKPGTLFRFGKNVPTGYETPFDENAFILIFKGDRTTKVEREFIEYLQGLAERLKKEQAAGVPFLLKDLPKDHAARAFARKLNPRFDGDND
jgi:quercetin dioxygenase-like cupin family protein